MGVLVVILEGPRAWSLVSAGRARLASSSSGPEKATDFAVIPNMVFAIVLDKDAVNHHH